MTAKQLADKFGVSITLIYRKAKELGRLPTEYEMATRNKRRGREPKNWKA